MHLLPIHEISASPCMQQERLNDASNEHHAVHDAADDAQNQEEFLPEALQNTGSYIPTDGMNDYLDAQNADATRHEAVNTGANSQTTAASDPPPEEHLDARNADQRQDTNVSSTVTEQQRARQTRCTDDSKPPPSRTS